MGSQETVSAPPDLSSLTMAELDEGLRCALVSNNSPDIGRIMAELNKRAVMRFRARFARWPVGAFELTDDERREPNEPAVDVETGFYDA